MNKKNMKKQHIVTSVKKSLLLIKNIEKYAIMIITQEIIVVPHIQYVIWCTRVKKIFLCSFIMVVIMILI